MLVTCPKCLTGNQVEIKRDQQYPIAIQCKVCGNKFEYTKKEKIETDEELRKKFERSDRNKRYQADLTKQIKKANKKKKDGGISEFELFISTHWGAIKVFAAILLFFVIMLCLALLGSHNEPYEPTTHEVLEWYDQKDENGNYINRGEYNQKRSY